MASFEQVMVHCGAILHSAWHNPWHEARKGLLLQWVPKDVAGGLAASRIECVALPAHEGRPRRFAAWLRREASPCVQIDASDVPAAACGYAGGEKA